MRPIARLPDGSPRLQWFVIRADGWRDGTAFKIRDLDAWLLAKLGGDLVSLVLGRDVDGEIATTVESGARSILRRHHSGVAFEAGVGREVGRDPHTRELGGEIQPGRMLRGIERDRRRLGAGGLEFHYHPLRDRGRARVGFKSSAADDCLQSKPRRLVFVAERLDRVAHFTQSSALLMFKLTPKRVSSTRP